mmetsp:Transcript_30090/g.80510  ORF Transcript_30090/g.80510 Transcript_30090/m.80510 type:complete len:147 (-) Transcript_30090:161-601(-)
MWDLIFMGWRWGRDEQLVTVVLRWLMQLLMNFTLGLIGALFVFVWRLWGLIAAYKPDPLTAAMYFGAAALSATVCVMSYLALMYAAAAGTVGVVGKALVDHARRIENDPQARAQRIRQQQQQQQRRQYRDGMAGGMPPGYRRTHHE